MNSWKVPQQSDCGTTWIHDRSRWWCLSPQMAPLPLCTNNCTPKIYLQILSYFHHQFKKGKSTPLTELFSILCNTQLSFPLQFSLVTQSCLTLCNPMNCSTSGLPVHHQLPGFIQTHVHPVGDAIHHLILCRPLLLLPPIPPSIRVFSNKSTLRMR